MEKSDLIIDFKSLSVLEYVEALKVVSEEEKFYYKYDSVQNPEQLGSWIRFLDQTVAQTCDYIDKIFERNPGLEVSVEWDKTLVIIDSRGAILPSLVLQKKLRSLKINLPKTLYGQVNKSLTEEENNHYFLDFFSGQNNLFSKDFDELKALRPLILTEVLIGGDTLRLISRAIQNLGLQKPDAMTLFSKQKSEELILEFKNDLNNLYYGDDTRQEGSCVLCSMEYIGHGVFGYKNTKNSSGLLAEAYNELRMYSLNYIQEMLNRRYL